MSENCALTEVLVLATKSAQCFRLPFCSPLAAPNDKMADVLRRTVDEAKSAVSKVGSYFILILCWMTGASVLALEFGVWVVASLFTHSTCCTALNLKYTLEYFEIHCAELQTCSSYLRNQFFVSAYLFSSFYFTRVQE